MSAREFRLILPLGELMNLNAERTMHHQTRSRRVRAIRKAAYHLADGAEPLHCPVAIEARFQWADARARDTSNWFPTVKAMVDGLVDAGLIPRDDDRTVRHTGLSVDLPAQPGLKGHVQILLTVRPIEGDAA